MLHTRLKWILLCTIFAGSLLLASYNDIVQHTTSKDDVLEATADEVVHRQVVAKKQHTDCMQNKTMCKKGDMKAPASDGNVHKGSPVQPVAEAYVPPSWYKNYTPVCITDSSNYNFGDFDSVACPELVEKVSLHKRLPPDPGADGKKT